MIRPTTPSNQSQRSTPPRSTTFPTKPIHKQHISHHAHRVHHHRHQHHDTSVPQSAILPTTTSNPFGDFLSKTNGRIDGKSDGNKTLPRGLEQQHEAEKEKEKEKQRDGETWQEVERLRERRNAVDDDLRTRLSALSTLSTTTTRRLDYTYYSLLSSISSLTTAISSLSTLSSQISTLQTHFASSSSSLRSEITNQISSYDSSFDVQARRISQLETRMKKGREQVGRLGERLDRVREKVEKSSMRDRESRRIFGRRLRLLWGFLGSVIGLFLILATTRQWRGNEYATREELLHLANRTEGVSEKVVGLQEDVQQQRERQGDNESLGSSTRTGIGVDETTSGSPATSSMAADADAMLRLFDEL